MTDEKLIKPIDQTIPSHLEPRTTQEEDRHSASQRKVNLTWEFTQSIIAVMVTSAAILSVFILDGGTSMLLSNAFFLVIGFYFGRTNHTNVGGTKENYQGR